MKNVEEAEQTPSVVMAYLAERDTAWVRFAVIFFNVPLYLWALPHHPGRHALALAVATVAVSYAVVIVAARPYERFPVLRTARYTLVTDSALIALWLYATGGIHSPFYALWPLSLLAITFRFGPRVVGAATAAYALADLAMLAVSGDLAGALPIAAVRTAYIVLAGVLGMLLGHRWGQAVTARVDMAHDVARKEHLLRDADRLRALTEAAFEGIVIQQAGRILEINPAATEIFGRSRQELLGAHVMDLVDPESLETVRDRLEFPRDTRFEAWIRRPDGERRRLVVQGRDATFHGGAARVTAMRDVTDEYAAQKAKETAALQRMEIERLQELDRFKTRFINTAAHELNTPLTPIKLQLHLLRDELHERPRALDLLERNLDRLGRLVTDMLNIARLQSGRMKISARTVDLAAVCEEMTEMFEPAALEKGVRVERLLPERLMAYADPERVVQILTNLLSNAVKFTPAGGHVTVVGRETVDGVRLEVIDTGRGVPLADQERLFQPFSQVHEDPSIPGTGLGLYICKNLAEAMGGSVGCDSDDQSSGSRFWVELRRDAPADGPAEQGPDDLPAPRYAQTPSPAEGAGTATEAGGRAGGGSPAEDPLPHEDEVHPGEPATAAAAPAASASAPARPSPARPSPARPSPARSASGRSASAAPARRSPDQRTGVAGPGDAETSGAGRPRG